MILDHIFVTLDTKNIDFLARAWAYARQMKKVSNLRNLFCIVPLCTLHTVRSETKLIMKAVSSRCKIYNHAEMFDLKQLLQYSNPRP